MKHNYYYEAIKAHNKFVGFAKDYDIDDADLEGVMEMLMISAEAIDACDHAINMMKRACSEGSQVYAGLRSKQKLNFKLEKQCRFRMV